LRVALIRSRQILTGSGLPPLDQLANPVAHVS